MTGVRRAFTYAAKQRAKRNRIQHYLQISRAGLLSPIATRLLKQEFAMPRPCQRMHLESGLRLDVNRLAQRGFIHPGALSGAGISWTDSYSGNEIASGIISSDLRGPYEGYLHIEIGSLKQEIHMVARKRHFGGHQWFFICPDTTRRAMVL
jgi:hypothetical protein